jgi:hypothetical protein
VFIGNSFCGILPNHTKQGKWYTIHCKKNNNGDSVKLITTTNEYLHIQGIKVNALPGNSRNTKITRKRGVSRRTITRMRKISSKRSHIERLSGINGNGYRGRQIKTKSGKKCAPWSASGTHTKEKFARAGLEGNYCRNPDFRKRNTIWCFT